MRRFLIGYLAVLLLLVIVVGCGGGGSNPQSKKSTKSEVPSPEFPLDRPVDVSKLPREDLPKPQSFSEVFPGQTWTGKGPVNILVIGSDARIEEGPNAGSCPGPGRGQRADALHVVSINPVSGQGTILNIPRDSWVPLYRREIVNGKWGAILSRYARINESLFWYGPTGVVETVQKLTGLPIHYYAMTTFCGLIQLVNQLGDIRVLIPYDVRPDPPAAFSARCPGLYHRVKYEKWVLQKGWQELNGCQALYFSRSRHYAPGGDRGRTSNQAMVLLAGLRKFQQLSKTPMGMVRVVQIVRSNVVFNVSRSEFMRLARLAQTLKSEKFGSYTLEGRDCRINGASVICLYDSNNDPSDAVFRDIRNDAVINKCYT